MLIMLSKNYTVIVKIITGRSKIEGHNRLGTEHPISEMPRLIQEERQKIDNE